MRFEQLRCRTLIRLINAAASTKVNRTIVALVLITAAPIATVFALLERAQSQSAILLGATLKGRAAYGDWRSDAAGIRRQIKVSDLPAPDASGSRVNFPAVVEKPDDAQLKVVPGFEVSLFASGLVQPRLIRVAPNGDIFVAESLAGRIRVLRPTNSGRPGLRPFGRAPEW